MGFLSPNPQTLLDQYKDDDEDGLTANLIDAIRSWNLQRPLHDCEADGSSTLTNSLCSATDNDIATNTARSPNTEKSNKTGLASQISKIFIFYKTPCRGNYSSRPSSLISRILGGEESPSISDHPSGSEEKLNSIQVSLNDVKLQTPTNVNTVKRERQVKIVDLHRESENKNYVHESQSEHKSQCTNDDALHILRETANILGLPENDIHSILPVVRRLARVVMTHVPRLESFVDDVCNIVIPDGIDNDENKSIVSPSRSKTQVHNKKVRRRKPKMNLQARKDRMDKAVSTLKEKWPSGINQEKEDEATLLTDRRALLSVDPNIRLEKSSFVKEKTPISSSRMSDAAFRDNVMGRLSRRVRHQHRVNENSSNCKESTTSSLMSVTHTEAIQMIDELITCEETAGILDSVTRTALEFSIKESGPFSPVNGNSILQELFDTDNSTLRRFTMHFASLFSLHQNNEILPKMNDLYVFSKEASVFIQNTKQLLGLPESSSIHIMAHRLVTILESKEDSY
jgi:hypothetical protein